ncbi:Zinc finger and SCAN domain-containing protein 29 [Liparis tanakae]|uniref:Zinc finger and SCAN domain-containing protein 29 n=1 Tax=Liparis tanakae TaxID=230148 RepID=A0A4Z2FZS4_9TELE|nr:Zinc finger and SCAN domain-containing protein 29 [Liparis tanakae]
MDDCILSSLSLPPGIKTVRNSDSCSPTLKDSNPLEHKRHLDALFSTSSLERAIRRSSETVRQGLEETRDLGGWQLDIGGGDFSLERKAWDPAAELAALDVTADADSVVNGSLIGTRILRKRKLSAVVDIPPQKKPAEAKLKEEKVVLDSPVDDENSDSQEDSLPVVTDTKVPWSDEETLNLLDIWGKDSMQEALKGCLKNRHIFTKIAQKMCEGGFVRTVEQCQTRIKRLKKLYRKNRRNSKLDSKFYAQLKRILDSSGPSAVVPSVTFDVEDAIDEDELLEIPEDLPSVRQTTRLETGTRSAPWSDFESLSLITTWGEDKMERELKGINRCGHIFNIISNNMAEQGFSRTPEHLKGQEQVECKFYHELGSFLMEDFPLLPKLEEIPEEPEDDFFSSQDLESAVGVQEDRRKVPWSDKETIILLEIWGDPQVQQSMRRIPHNGHIFTEISEKLTADGYPRSAGQCHTRIKRLKATYRHCQDNLNSPGTDRVDFKFYDLLEQILDKQPSTSSTAANDSIEISEDSNSESVAETDGENGTSAEETATGSWTDEETLALIEIWGEEDVQSALRGFFHNGDIYADLSQRLCKLGYPKTSEQCRWKVESLRNNFQQSYERKKSGRRVNYRFYHPLEEILGQEAASIDEYDEKDPDQDQDQDQEQANQEQADQDPEPGTDVNTAWTEEETVALVEVWAADDVQHSLNTCVRNGHIFNDISEKMVAAGYPRSTEQCHSRIKRLKKSYRRYCNSWRSGGRPTVFRYFHLLAPVLGDDSILSTPELDSAASDASLQALIDNEEQYKFFNEMNAIFGRELRADHSAPEPSIKDEPDDCAQKTGTQWLPESSKMAWSDRETEVLLNIWGSEDIQQTLKGCKKNKHIFVQISEVMTSQGYLRTPGQCQTRIKRLRANFRHFLEGRKGEKQECKYFDQLVRIFGNKYAANSDPLADDAADGGDLET